jgi:hypothetical protein
MQLLLVSPHVMDSLQMQMTFSLQMEQVLGCAFFNFSLNCPGHFLNKHDITEVSSLPSFSFLRST